MSTAIYAVTGLTCADCMAELLGHVHSVSGVTHGAMDLFAGGASPLLVVSETQLGAKRRGNAVENAGFDLVSPSGRQVHRAGCDPSTQIGITDPRWGLYGTSGNQVA